MSRKTNDNDSGLTPLYIRMKVFHLIFDSGSSILPEGTYILNNFQQVYVLRQLPVRICEYVMFMEPFLYYSSI